MNEISKTEVAMRQSDHDLLVTLHEKVIGIKEDIKEVKDGLNATVADHEVRIRAMEKKQWINTGIAGAVGAGLSLVAQYFIQNK